MLHQHQTQYVGVKDTITSTSNTICQRQRHSVLHQHQREYVSVKDTITSTSNTVCQRQRYYYINIKHSMSASDITSTSSTTS